MPIEQEPSLEDQEKLLLQQAADADAEGRTIDDPTTSIAETQEHSGDPAEDTNDEANKSTTTSDGDGTQESETPSGEQDETQNAEKSNPDEGTQDADPSKKQPEEQHQKSKQEKEDERRERSWKKLEEAKAEFLREKAQWQAQQAALSSQPSQNAAETPQTLAKAFEDIAKRFEDEGDFDKADEARRKAEELRKLPPSKNSPLPQDNQHFQAAWNTNIERAMNDFPEMKDPNSVFGKAVIALINAPDSASYFKGRPDGIYVAAQLTRMKMNALRVPELEKENASLKEEIKKLRQGVSLPDTGSRSRAGESVPLEKMTLEQQEAYWKRQAELADAGMPTI